MKIGDKILVTHPGLSNYVPVGTTGTIVNIVAEDIEILYDIPWVEASGKKNKTPLWSSKSWFKIIE